MKRCHIVVHGRVQGVFYRAFAHEHARVLNLNGYARNMSDGSVEIVVEGDEEKIKEFIEKLKKGPNASRVERLDTEWNEARNEFKWFTIMKSPM